MNPYRRFFTAFFCFLIIPILCCVLFNFKMDPYGIWGQDAWFGLNHVKNLQRRHERLFKAVAVMRVRPTTILLGSSRTEVGLDPKHPLFASRTGIYNLGIAGPNMGEVEQYFEHALANQPKLEEVILGIDFFMFNDLSKNRADFDKELIGRTTIPSKTLLEVLFSFDALEASRSTLFFNLNPSPIRGVEFRADGMEKVKYLVSRKKSFEGTIKEFLRRIRDNPMYGKYRYSQSAFESLAQVVRICREKQIRLTLFISPSHATEWEMIRLTGLWPEFENWKRQVAELYPLWDFSGYNFVTTEAVAEDMENYIDHSHYTPKIGTLVLNRMFHVHEKDVPKDFGVLLTPENVEPHLSKIRAEQIMWIDAHTDVVAWIKDIQSQVQ